MPRIDSLLDLAELLGKNVAVGHDEPLGVAQQQRVGRHRSGSKWTKDPCGQPRLVR